MQIRADAWHEGFDPAPARRQSPGMFKWIHAAAIIGFSDFGNIPDCRDDCHISHAVT